MYTALAVATTFVGPRSSLVLIVVGVASVLRYVVVPLRMLKKPGQLPARFVPAIKDNDSDPGLWGFVEATATALAREGFTPAPPGTPFTSTTNRTAVLQLFTHPKNGDVASVIAILKATGQTHSVLGFTTNFADSTIFTRATVDFHQLCPNGHGRIDAGFPTNGIPLGYTPCTTRA
jgi:hypothetical protein